jgi:membrane protein required for colicin V production
MNYIDIILLLMLVLAAFGGFRKGFIEELAGLVALILGIWAALHFSGLVAHIMAEYFNFQGNYLSVIAFIITFVVVLILVSLIGSAVSKIVHAVHLGLINRLAGFLFGFIKGALILSIVLVVFNKIDEDVHLLSREAKNNSRLFEPIRYFAPTVFPFLDFWGEFDHSHQTDPL